MIRNWWLLAGLVVTIISVVSTCLYILPKQFRENQRPRNDFSRLRLYILAGELFLTAGMSLGFATSIQSLNIPPRNNWSKVASISNRVPYAAIAFILILIYNYSDDNTTRRP